MHLRACLSEMNSRQGQQYSLLFDTDLMSHSILSNVASVNGEYHRSYRAVFSFIKEKFIHEIEHFDWWKHPSGYSLRMQDELLF